MDTVIALVIPVTAQYTAPQKSWSKWSGNVSHLHAYNSGSRDSNYSFA